MEDNLQKRCEQLLVKALEALEIFYGSGWEYTDDDIEKIEAAIAALKESLKPTNCDQCKYRGTHEGQWCYMQEQHPGEYCIYFKAGN